MPEGHAPPLCKSIYGTKQAACKWHRRLSTWMAGNEYPAANSEETIFIKWEGDDFIIHGLFMDDLQTV